MATKKDQTGVFRTYVVEFIGSFFLVMTIIMTMSVDAGWLMPVAVGLTLTMLTYAGGYISGAHFNPAVSLAAYLRGKLDAGDVLPYMVGQFLGATLATMLAGFLLSSTPAIEMPVRELEIVPSLIAEILGTILFVFVYLNMFATRRTSGNSYYGITIGFAYLACLFMFTTVSVGAFNPAVALGLTMGNITAWDSIWIYIVANSAGGVLAAFLSQYVNGTDH